MNEKSSDSNKIEWCDILSWGEEQLQDLRFIGYAYIKQGKYDVALSFFEALVAVNPSSIYDVQTLGAIYLQRQENTKALFYLNQALKLNARHLPTKINRCKALLCLGRKTEGLEIARELKESKDPDISSVASALLLSYSR